MLLWIDGENWVSMRLQEDSTKMHRVTAAALFFLNITTVTIGAAPSPLETGGDLEQVTSLHAAVLKFLLQTAATCNGVL